VHLCFGQANLGDDRALVGRPQQLFDAVRLVGHVDLTHVGEEFAHVGGSAPRIGRRLTRLGVCFTSVRGHGSGIRYRLAQIRLDSSRVRDELAHVGGRRSFVRGGLPLVCIRVALVGNSSARSRLGAGERVSVG
jgi:hypothetical protein